MVSSKSNFHITFQRRIFFDLGSLSFEGQAAFSPVFFQIQANLNFQLPLMNPTYLPRT